MSEALPYLQANKLAYNSFMVASRGSEISGSETKRTLLHLQLLENQPQFPKGKIKRAQVMAVHAVGNVAVEEP